MKENIYIYIVFRKINTYKYFTYLRFEDWFSVLVGPFASNGYVAGLSSILWCDVLQELNLRGLLWGNDFSD